MFPPRVGGFEPPYIQLLLSYFIFLEGGGSIHGVQHSPKCTAKVRKIIELAKFPRYFFAVFRLFYTHTSHSTIDNRTHSFGGRNATSVEREAQTPRLLNLRLPQDAQQEFQAFSARHADTNRVGSFVWMQYA